MNIKYKRKGHDGINSVSLVTKQTDSPAHSCSSCYQEFASHKILLTHLLQDHEISIPVQCPKCEVVSENIKKLRKHNMNVHLETPNITQCKICKKFMKTGLNAHMKRHSLQETFECDECGHKSTSKNNLQIHKRVHSDVKMYQCKHCDKAFKWKSSVKIHTEAAHSKSAPLFMCDECSHPFKDKTNLAKHMFTHKTEKPHTCDKCGKGWIRLDFLKNHKCVAK